MDYEKRYKDALANARLLMESNPSDEGLQNWVKSTFPELTKEEDERMRIFLIDYFDKLVDGKSEFSLEPETRRRIIEWLKQLGEQKDIQSNDELEFDNSSESTDWTYVCKDIFVEGVVLAQMKEKSDACNGYVLRTNPFLRADLYERFIKMSSIEGKASQWKPSDKHIGTLEYYMHHLVCNEHKEVLYSLMVELKELRRICKTKLNS